MIRRNRAARREGYHFFVWWLINRKYAHPTRVAEIIEYPGWYADGKWIPWEKEATRFASIAAVDAILTGYALVEDGFAYTAEKFEERHWDNNSPRFDYCSACERLSALSTSRQDYDKRRQAIEEAELMTEDARGLEMDRHPLREDEIEDGDSFSWDEPD